MAQRAYTNQIRVLHQSSTQVRAQTNDVQYLDSASGSTTLSGGVFVDLPYDASPCAIIEAVGAEIVAQQPVGFSLDQRDVIVPGYVRGAC